MEAAPFFNARLPRSASELVNAALQIDDATAVEPHLHQSHTYGACATNSQPSEQLQRISSDDDCCDYLRAIDVIIELEWLLVGKAAYGQPGTDGSFTSNLIKVIQNENEILSLFYVNPQHPFSAGERACALFLGFGINCIANNYLYHDPVWSLYPFESSLYVAAAMSVLNFVLRYVFEKRCFIGYHVVSDDIKGGVKKVSAVECLELVTGVGGLVIAVGGLGLLGTALNQYPGDIHRYLASQVMSSLIISTLLLIPFQLGLFSFATASGYVNDRYEFEKKWCDFHLPSSPGTMELIRPKTISEVAHAVETRTADGLSNLNFQVFDRKNADENKAHWDRIFCLGKYSADAGSNQEEVNAPWVVRLVKWLLVETIQLDDYFEQKCHQFLIEKGERAPFKRCKTDLESGDVVVKPLAKSVKLVLVAAAGPETEVQIL